MAVVRVAFSAAFLALGGEALRNAKRESAEKSSTDKSAGIVEGLYTWGAPGVAFGGLRNLAASDGCFQGKRLWIQEVNRVFSFVDPVVTVAGLAGYRHPFVEGYRMNINGNKVEREPCATGTVNRPRGTGNARLHAIPFYREVSGWLGQEFANFAFVATRYSVNFTDAFVAREAPQYGWNLVGRGKDMGNSDRFGGPQASNLFQNPRNLECMITFQYTRSTEDWYANLDARARTYCGTNMRVHAGFRNHMLRMVRDPSWQANVRPKLGSCSKVSVVGASLGGATASLFAGCANSGNSGDSDYKLLSWTKGRATKLPNFA